MVSTWVHHRLRVNVRTTQSHAPPTQRTVFYYWYFIYTQTDPGLMMFGLAGRAKVSGRVGTWHQVYTVNSSSKPCMAYCRPLGLHTTAVCETTTTTTTTAAKKTTAEVAGTRSTFVHFFARRVLQSFFKERTQARYWDHCRQTAVWVIRPCGNAPTAPAVGSSETQHVCCLRCWLDGVICSALPLLRNNVVIVAGCQ